MTLTQLSVCQHTHTRRTTYQRAEVSHFLGSRRRVTGRSSFVEYLVMLPITAHLLHDGTVIKINGNIG